MSDFFLFAISLAVTALGLVGSWAAYRRRGVASGMRGLAWSSVPMAGYLTGLTKFLSGLVFSPVKWAGVVLFGLGAVLYVTSGVMLRRGSEAGQAEIGQKPKREAREVPAADPDLAEIDKILKNRGIT
jgi:hypothetical protein